MELNQKKEISEPLLKDESKQGRGSLFIIRDKNQKTCCQKFSDYWVNDGTKFVFIVIYVLANIALFVQRFLYYRYADINNPAEYKDALAYQAMSYGVCFARGGASALRLNCSFIYIPVLRNFLSWLRGTWVNDWLPIDKNIVFHRYIGWAIAFWAAVHICGHYFNFYAISTLNLKTTQIFFPGVQSTVSVMVGTWEMLVGYTGQIAVFCLFLMITTAIDRMRRNYFELFWYTHHLFIVFTGVLIAHGMQQILEPAQFWLWVIGPFTLYVIERTIRIIRGAKDTILVKAIQHPSKVIELRMGRASGWNYKPGQYLFLNCPFIARQEWHPFTISSSPEGEDYLSVHIRIVGDWTGKLYKLLNPDKIKEGVIRENMEIAPGGLPILRVDGPFGAASEEVFDFEYVMLIGAGIGVTPFASILKTIRFRLEQKAKNLPGKPISIKKVHFYWINRDKAAFEWFAELLKALEEQNVDKSLEINVFLTSRVTKEQDLMELMMEDESGKDSVTGLDARTFYGRPAWNKIYSDHAETYANKTIGVFFCGPQVLSKALKEQCKIHTRGSTRFVYHKENF